MIILVENHIKVFVLENIQLNSTKLSCLGLWFVHYQNSIWQPFPPSKMATATKNWIFFEWQLLL